MEFIAGFCHKFFAYYFTKCAKWDTKRMWIKKNWIQLHWNLKFEKENQKKPTPNGMKSSGWNELVNVTRMGVIGGAAADRWGPANRVTWLGGGQWRTSYCHVTPHPWTAHSTALAWPNNVDRWHTPHFIHSPLANWSRRNLELFSFSSSATGCFSFRIIWDMFRVGFCWISASEAATAESEGEKFHRVDSAVDFEVD